jgi:predicted ABC-type ATPase
MAIDENRLRAERLIGTMLSFGMKPDQKSLEPLAKAYKTNPELYDKVFNTLDYMGTNYGKDIFKFTPEQLGVAVNQSKFYQYRTENGYDPIKIKDIGWDPSQYMDENGQYDDTLLEATGEWYKHNKGLPQPYQQQEFENSYNLYKQERDEKSLKDQYYLAGYDRYGEEPFIWNSGWQALGFQYDLSDPDEVRRKQLKMPPKDFLEQYSVHKEGETAYEAQMADEDEQRLMTGKLPLAFDEEYQSKRASEDMVNGLVNQGMPVQEAIKQTMLFRNGIESGMSVEEALDVVQQDTSARATQTQIKDDLVKMGMDEQAAAAGSMEFSQNVAAGQTPEDAYKAVYDKLPQVQQAKKVLASQQEVRNIFAGVKGVGGYNSPMVRQGLNNKYAELIEQKVREYLDTHTAIGQGYPTDLIKQNMDEGLDIFDISAQALGKRGVTIDALMTVNKSKKFTEEQYEQRIFDWAKLIGLDANYFPQSKAMMRVLYADANQPDAAKDKAIIEAGANSKDNKMVSNFYYGWTPEQYNNPKARFPQKVIDKQGTTSHALNLTKKALTGADPQEAAYSLLTQQEKDTVNYHYGLKDKDTADKLLKIYLDRHATDFSQQKASEHLKELAPQPGESGFNIAGKKVRGFMENIIGVLPNIGVAGQAMVEGISNPDMPMSETQFTMGSRMAQAGAQSVTEGMSEGAGKFVTEAALSISQNLPLLMMGPAAAAILATSSAGQSALEAKDKGGTAEQSLARGVAFGVAEYIGEKIALDRLFKFLKTGGKTLKKSVMFTLSQAGVEATEEMATEVMQVLSDLSIMKDKSQVSAYMEQYMTDNPDASHSDAVLSTTLKVAEQVAYAGGQGALSGAFFGGGASLMRSMPSGKSQEAPESIGAATLPTAPTTEPAAAPLEATQQQTPQPQGAAEQTFVKVAKGERTEVTTFLRNKTVAEPYIVLGRKDGQISGFKEFGDLNAAGQHALDTGGKLYHVTQTPTGNKLIETLATPMEAAAPVKTAKPAAKTLPQKVAPTVELHTRDTLKTLDAKTRSYVGLVDKFAGLVGSKVNWAKSIKDGNGNEANGFFDAKTQQFTLSTQAERISPKSAYSYVAAHEMTHALESSNDYTELRDTVLGYFSEEDLKAERKRLSGLYRVKDKGIIDREIVANWASENLFANERSIRRFVNEHRGVAGKILNFFDDVLAKIKKQDMQLDNEFRRARKLWQDAFDEAAGKEELGRTGTDYSLQAGNTNLNTRSVSHETSSVPAGSQRPGDTSSGAHSLGNQGGAQSGGQNQRGDRRDGAGYGIESHDDPASFNAAIHQAIIDNPHGPAVHEYTAEEYADMKLFMAPDGSAGIAVKPDGDIVSVFKNPAKNPKPGIAHEMLITALRNGGRKLDCFDGYLTKLYSKHGFKPVSRVAFDRDYAPEGWNFERDGEPDIVFFTHLGESDIANIESGNYISTTYDIAALPLYASYDNAMAYRDEQLDSVQYSLQDGKFKVLDGSYSFDVYKNPTDEQYREVFDRFKEEYPRAPRGEPKIRTTYDEKGNTYIWMSGDAMHSSVESFLWRKYHLRANQNKMFDLGERVAYSLKIQPSPEGEAILSRLETGENVTLDEIEAVPEIANAIARTKGMTQTVDRYSPAELETRAAEALAKLNEMGSAAKDKNGKWGYTGNVAQNRRIDIVIGPSAAGKSSVLANPLSNRYSSRIIDADEAKKLLPEFDDGYGAGIVHEESSAISKAQIAEAIDRGDNIVLPVVWAKYEKARADIQRLKDAGYEVHVHLNQLDINKALGRALRRFYNEGRYIPLNVVKAIGEGPTKTYQKLRAEEGLLDGYTWLNNDVQRGQPPVEYETTERAGLWDAGQLHRDAGERNLGRDSGGFGSEEGAGETQGQQVPNQGVAYSINGEPFATARQKYGELPNRPVVRARSETLPARFGDKDYTRRTYQTAYESANLNDLQADEAAMQAAMDTYQRVTDVGAATRADNLIANIGYVNALRQWDAVVVGTQPASKDSIVLAEKLMIDAFSRGDSETGMELLSQIAVEGTRAGQMVQAIHMIKSLSPSGQALHINRIVDKYNIELAKRGRPRIVLDKKLVTEYYNAPSLEEADKIRDKIIADIADQLPATLSEKLTAYRYMSMLLNLRTHERNIISNAAMLLMKTVKDTVGTGLEKAFIRDKSQRTKAWINVTSEKDRALLSYAAKDARIMQDILMSGGKEGDIESAVEEHRKIFNTRWLEKVRRFGTGTLNKEDWWFLMPNYTVSLAEVLKARGLDASTVDAKALAQAREVAIQEAKEATFRDFNSLSSLISQLEKKNAFTRLIVGGLMPFKRTPPNIVKRGIEYSPLGLLKGLSYDLVRVARGNLSATAAVNNIAKGLTGTAVFVLGVVLSSLGILVGKQDDDQRNAYYQKDLGEQPYSIRIGDAYYTIDWISPENMPFFMGVELANQLSSGPDASVPGAVSRFLDSMTTVSDPVFQLSMLQGINKALKSYGESNAFGTMATETAKSYLQQYIPTVFGQLARTIDDTRRSTYTPKDATLPAKAGSFAKQTANKLPGASMANQPYIDKWGREQEDPDSLFIRTIKNFASPGYLSYDKTTSVDEEIQRLVEATQESALIPAGTSGTRTLDDKPYYLNEEEMTTYQKQQGQLSFDTLETLFGLSDYRRLDSDIQQKAIRNVYSYARDIADQDFFTGRQIPRDISTASKAVEDGKSVGLSAADVILFRTQEAELKADYDRSGKPITGTKKAKVMDLLDAMGFSPEQQETMLVSAGYNTVSTTAPASRMPTRSSRSSTTTSRTLPSRRK